MIIDEILAIPPSFYGALIGSFISGSVAIGILCYQTYLKNKENNFRSYGTMKMITAQLIIFHEYERMTKEIFSVMEKHPQIKESFREQLAKPKSNFEETLKFLENERGNIPYSFISRYFVVTNSIRVVIRTLDMLMVKGSIERSEETLFQLMEHSNQVNDEFIKYVNRYLKEIEKKYKTKDYY